VSAFSIMTDLVRGDDGLMLHAFDPIMQMQIDAALEVIDEKGMGRMMLLPDLNAKCVESLENRLRLLSEAAKFDHRLLVPSLSDLKSLYRERNMTCFLSKYSQVYDKHQSVNKANNQSLRFRKNPSMNEGLLPESVAKLVAVERLYGHDGKRGYYGLPRWLTKLIDLEQRLNNRIKDTSKFFSVNDSDLPKEYYPEERPVFSLLHVDVPAKEVSLLKTGKLPRGATVSVGNRTLVRFFVHPHSRHLYQDAFRNYEWNEEYWATPTSSHRSLIAWDPITEEAPFGVKTTLDSTIGGSLRHLSESQIERASASSALVNSLNAKVLGARGIIFIDEPIGVLLKSTECGYALRTMTAPTGRAEFVPMFSLYSKPPGSQSMIIDMIEKSGLSAKVFVDKYIMVPLIDHYSYLSWAQGFIGEPHEQNLLMEVRDGLPTQRILYRDLAGFHIRPDIRKASGKDMSFVPSGIKYKSLKSDRADVVDNAIMYLRHSNFFALIQSLNKRFPDVNATYVDQQFRIHMSRNIEVYTGIKVDGKIPAWRAALKSALKNGILAGPSASKKNVNKDHSRATWVSLYLSRLGKY
jgi:hypothetical protein